MDKRDIRASLMGRDDVGIPFVAKRPGPKTRRVTLDKQSISGAEVTGDGETHLVNQVASSKISMSFTAMWCIALGS